MLEILGKLATKLQPFRTLSYLSAALLVGIIVTQLLQPPTLTQSSNANAMLSFVGFIWLLLFNILLSLFHNISKIDKGQKDWFTRIKIKMQRGIYHLLALLFVVLTLVIVFLSVRMLRI